MLLELCFVNSIRANTVRRLLIKHDHKKDTIGKSIVAAFSFH